jgi:glycosyltransferase involved in cell wall biosynthesis
MSRVDVFVPCYNYGRFLGQCVRSVLSQEGVEVRVLVLDDASHDDTEAVGRQLAAADGRVEYRRHGANRGHVATYNGGIEWAGGDYCLLLSADDMLTPGSLRRAARLLDAHPEAGFVYGRGIRTADPALAGSRDTERYDSWVTPGDEFLRSLCETSENVVDTATAVVRTSLQRRVGGYRNDLPHSCDMEMWLRLSLHAAVGYVDADQGYYRLHGQNMSEEHRHVGDFLQRKAVFDVLFREHRGLIAGWERLQESAARALAQDAFWKANKAFDRGEVTLCKSLLAFARDVDPRLRYRPRWWRMGLKRVIGHRAWSAVRPLARRLRGLPVPAACEPTAGPPC